MTGTAHDANAAERNAGGSKEVQVVEKDIGFAKRYVLALMVFLGFCTLYALRVNLNVAIGAMCNNHTIYANGFYIKKVAEFDWDSKLQGTVLGSFYYGYIVLQIPGGWLALKFGGTRIFGFSLFIASILTLLTPLAARTSVYALIALRVLEGISLGVLFPCNHAIWGKWAPPLERSRLFSLTVAGCPVGTILTMPLTGLLTKYGFDGGWASVFYVFGAVGLLWFFVWCLIVHPDPATHPTISDAERNYILTSLQHKKNSKPPAVPWLKILTSVPVWATIVANFCADWGLYTILICIPKFFQKVLGFDIATTGFLVSLPYLIKAIVGPSGGIIADMLITYKMTVRNVRRMIFSIGCSTAAIFIVGVGYAKSKAVALALLCTGVGITGLNSTGYAVNILDIAPNFAGVIIGFSNVFGSMPGFISPQIVGYITTKNTAEEWQIVFWITAFVYAFGVVFFFLTCSGDKQPWNDPASTGNQVAPLGGSEEQAASGAGHGNGKGTTSTPATDSNTASGASGGNTKGAATSDSLGSNLKTTQPPAQRQSATLPSSAQSRPKSPTEQPNPPTKLSPPLKQAVQHTSPTAHRKLQPEDSQQQPPPSEGWNNEGQKIGGANQEVDPTAKKD